MSYISPRSSRSNLSSKATFFFVGCGGGGPCFLPCAHTFPNGSTLTTTNDSKAIKTHTIENRCLSIIIPFSIACQGCREKPHCHKRQFLTPFLRTISPHFIVAW